MTRLRAFQVDTAELAADPNIDISGKMEWKGEWSDAGSPIVPYEVSDVVRDGDWTMVANTTTTDRAAPQPIGDVDTQPPIATVWAENNLTTAVVEMRHEYVTTKPGWLKSIRIRTAQWDLDVVTRITIVNNTTGTVSIINNPILKNDDWTTIALDNVIIDTGSSYDIWYEYYNSSKVNTITGGWNSNESTGAPITQEFNIDDRKSPTVVEISHDDLDANTRQLELDGVVVGSIMHINETGSTKRNLELKVTAVDTTSLVSTKYSVDILQNGPDDIRDDKVCTITIDVPITQPSVYNYNTDLWATSPSWVNITSKLYLDGVLQVDVNDGYGIEVVFQEASISTAWDLLAISSTGSVLAPTNTSHFLNITTAPGSPGIIETSLPAGWSTTYNAVGDFTITHNLNDLNIGFALSVMYNAGARTINPKSIGPNSISFQISDAADVAVEGNVVGRILF